MQNSIDLLHSHNQGHSLPGIFYKQDLTYIIEIKQVDSKGGDVISTLPVHLKASSPNESKVSFAKITRTLFADNTNDINLTNGIIVGVAEHTNSELLAIAQIPSQILSSFTTAASQVFSGAAGVFANQNTSQTDQLQAMQSLEKIQKCEAVKALNDPNGKTGDDKTTAYANILAACQ